MHPRRLLVLGCTMTTLTLAADSAKLDYPKTKTVEHVDTYHGTKVEDPYRWLENDVREDQAVRDWVTGQNKVTDGYLERIPEREAIRKRLEALWDYEKFSSPFKAGGRYFYYRNDGLQNQYVLYTMDSVGGEEREFLNPNAWSEDGTVALAGLAFSDDGRYAAFGQAASGSDWKTWRVMEVESGQILQDKLEWLKWGGAAWTPDGRGFFYPRFPEPKEGEEFQSLNLNMSVFYHRIGTAQAEDVLVYSRPEHPDWGFFPSVSEDGRYLILSISVGTDERNRVVYRDLAEPYAQPVELIGNFEYGYQFLGNDGPVFYFRTSNEAPRWRVIAIDTREPEAENWRTVVPEAAETMESAGIVGNLLVGEYLKDAQSQVKLFQLDGSFVREVELPGIVTAGGFSGKRTETETFYSVTGFATPPTTYRYDLITGESTKLREAKVDFDPAEYVTEQVFYKSKDGTKIPMFLTHKKGVEKNSQNPVLLYGYGGFNISLPPRFSISRLAWMEMGGIYAQANLRGGGEYGEEWHKAGTKLNKQNVFDDFIAAAEWLIENDYTNSSKLAIQGGSNGGLLVGAAITQRPDLYGAALPAVGVMDMLRFHKFTAGRYWTDDYGSSDNPEEFQALLAYSPYHNVKEDGIYPPTLVTTADTDDRVVPGHSFKFLARLQANQAGDAPILGRIETKAGHGAGKPTSKQIEEVADLWAFLVKNLGMTLEN